MSYGLFQCTGRHRHSGFSHFGGGFLSGGMGGRGFGAGRKLASADLQLLILKLLDEKSRHGYEIIRQLEERSRGFYIPSPGMVYPALTHLEELGHATMTSEGARKLYSITKSGQEYLSKHAAAADALLAQFGLIGERMERVRRALGAEEAGEDPLTPQQRGGSRELHLARRDLKLALLAKWHSSPEEQQRIAAILARAVAEITGS